MALFNYISIDYITKVAELLKTVCTYTVLANNNVIN